MADEELDEVLVGVELQAACRSLIRHLILDEVDEALCTLAAVQEDHDVYGLWITLWAVTSTVFQKMKDYAPEGTTFGWRPIEGTPEDLPVGIRTAALFMVAAGNDETDLAFHAFREAGEAGEEAQCDFIHTIIDRLQPMWAADFLRNRP